MIKSSGNHYILMNQVPVLEPDLENWAAWCNKTDRRVALTKKDNITVSTMFLGVDWGISRSAAPDLFESMIFGGCHNGEALWAATWEEAERNHAELCASAFPRGGAE